MSLTPDILFSGFDRAYRRFLRNEEKNILSDVSERNLCSHLACELKLEINNPRWPRYYVDTEYNRMQNGRKKVFLNGQMEFITITCDIIIHSRGEITEKDNLVAIEMKKNKNSEPSKNEDRIRLQALTKPWGETYLPDSVCGYTLGLFIVIDCKTNTSTVEEYVEGNLIRIHDYNGNDETATI